jgi:hypothetical protein
MKKKFALLGLGIIIAWVFIAFSAKAAEDTTNPSMCTGHEKIVFSCFIGKKVVSVCQIDNTGSVQYRVGKPGSLPEIALPENPAAKQGVVQGMNSFSGGGGAYIAFTKTDTRYVVHDYVTKQGDDTGVDVTRIGEKTFSIPCKTSPIGSLENDIPASIPRE